MKKINTIFVIVTLFISTLFTVSCRKDFDSGKVKIYINMSENDSREAAVNPKDYIESFLLYIVQKDADSDDYNVYTHKTLHKGTNYVSLKNEGIYFFRLLPLTKEGFILGETNIDEKSYLNNSKDETFGDYYFDCKYGTNTIFFNFDGSNFIYNPTVNKKTDTPTGIYLDELKQIIEHKLITESDFQNNIVNTRVNLAIQEYAERNNINLAYSKIIQLDSNVFNFKLDCSTIYLDNTNVIIKGLENNVDYQSINYELINTSDPETTSGTKPKLPPLFSLDNNSSLTLENIAINGDNNLENYLIEVKNNSTFTAKNVDIHGYNYEKEDPDKEDISSIIFGNIEDLNKIPNRINLENVKITDCRVKSIIKQNTLTQLTANTGSSSKGLKKYLETKANTKYFTENFGCINAKDITIIPANNEVDETDENKNKIDYAINTELPLHLAGKIDINSIKLTQDSANMMTYENIENVKNVNEILNNDSENGKIKLILEVDTDKRNSNITDITNFSKKYTAGLDFSCIETNDYDKNTHNFYVFNNINDSNYGNISIDTANIFDLYYTINNGHYELEPATDNNRCIYKNKIYYKTSTIPELDISYSNGNNSISLSAPYIGTEYKYEIPTIINSAVTFSKFYTENGNSIISNYFNSSHSYYTDKNVTINSSYDNNPEQYYTNFLMTQDNISSNEGQTLKYYAEEGFTITFDGKDNPDNYMLQFHGNIDLTNVEFTNTQKGIELFTNEGSYQIKLNNCKIPSIKVTDILLQNPMSKYLVIIPSGNVTSSIENEPIEINIEDDFIEEYYIKKNYPLIQKTVNYSLKERFHLNSSNFYIKEDGYIGEILKDQLESTTPSIDYSEKEWNLYTDANITSNKTITLTKGNNISCKNCINIKNNAIVTFPSTNAKTIFKTYNKKSFSIFNVSNGSTLNIQNIKVENNITDNIGWCNGNALFVDSSGTTNISDAEFYNIETNRPTIQIRDGITTLTNVNFLNEPSKRSTSNDTISILINNKGRLILKNTDNKKSRIDYIEISTGINQTEPLIIFDSSFEYGGDSINTSQNNIHIKFSNNNLQNYNNDNTNATILKEFVYNTKNNTNLSTIKPIASSDKELDFDFYLLSNKFKLTNKKNATTYINDKNHNWYYLVYTPEN